jgi:fermentation-respiration switch protein FrsA (DUF1100 family)
MAMNASEKSSNSARPQTWKRWLLSRFAWLLFFYACWCAFLYFYQDTLIFPAYMARLSAQTPADPSAEVFTLDIPDGGQVYAWYYPTRNTPDDNPAPAVVFCHGNAETVSDQIEIISRYRILGCAVLLVEYRGYGHADGKPGQAEIMADTEQFYDMLVARKEVDRTRIVFHGRSLGGGVAVQLAARHKPAALILRSTFTSVASMAHSYGGPSFLARHPFRTNKVLPHLDVPVLLFHGSRDSIIPVRHGRALRDMAKRVRYIEFDCGHNDFPGFGNEDRYWQEIESFLSEQGIIKSAAP